MPRNTTRAEPGRRDLTDAARASALFVQSVEKAMTVLSAFHHADGPLTMAQSLCVYTVLSTALCAQRLAECAPDSTELTFVVSSA